MASGPRSSGGSCSAPTPCRPATTTPTTARPRRFGPWSRRDYEAAFERFDLLVGPTSPTVAFRIGEKADDPLAMYLSDVFTIPVEPGRQRPPSRCLPGCPDGLPVGLQIIGPGADEATVLRAAWAFEQDLDSPPDPPRSEVQRDPMSAGRSGPAATRRSSGSSATVELATRTKMFCGCPTAFGAPPNTHVCPVCLGAARLAARPQREGHRVRDPHRPRPAAAGSPELLFHRKNYFYPDMPKNFQISQYDLPLCVDGHLDVEVDGETRRIGITRVHLEEDTGKTSTSGRPGASPAPTTRWSTTTAPASRWSRSSPSPTCARRRRRAPTWWSCGRSSSPWACPTSAWRRARCGCDANVSSGRSGTRVRHQGRGEEPELDPRRCTGPSRYEEERQRTALAERRAAGPGDPPLGRGTGAPPSSMRSKEFAFDYRYFPEPDLVPLEPAAEWVEGSGRAPRAAGRAAGPPGRGDRPARQGGRLAGPRPRGPRRLPEPSSAGRGPPACPEAPGPPAWWPGGTRRWWRGG